MKERLNELEDTIRNTLDDNKDSNTSVDIPQEIIDGLNIHIMTAVNAFYMRYGSYPKYVLLNRTAYGAYKIIRASKVGAPIISEEDTEMYANYEIICDPDQTVLARVLPKPELAFSILFDTEWESMRKLYEAQVTSMDLKLMDEKAVNDNLLEGYSKLQDDLKEIKKRGFLLMGIMLLIFVVIHIIY